MTQPPPALSPQQRAELKLQSEMKKRTSTSIFRGDGQLNAEVARDMSEGHVYLAEYLDMGRIPYPEDPHGAEHASHLARLAEYMAQLPGHLGGVIGGPLDVHDQKILHAMSMLYCVGRGQGPDGYEARSAAFADEFFRGGGGAGTYWGKQSVREEVCRLIFKHTDENEIRIDKRLQVFADAVRYETVRLSPNTTIGIQLLKDLCKPEQFHMGWSRDKANFRTYMMSRGWK
jgi:hypothetical protein